MKVAGYRLYACAEWKYVVRLHDRRKYAKVEQNMLIHAQNVPTEAISSGP